MQVADLARDPQAPDAVLEQRAQPREQIADAPDAGRFGGPLGSRSLGAALALAQRGASGASACACWGASGVRFSRSK
jgi:hypothetical protein